MTAPFPKHFLSIHDLERAHIVRLFELAGALKRRPQDFADRLQGTSLAMIFQKSSTRTRVSFEVGASQLGATAVFLSTRDIQLGRGETVSDTGKVLSRYVDAIMARTYSHRQIIDLAESSSVPVINGLSDDLHPCQGLTDFFTMLEIFGSLEGLRVAYVGDGNNTACSLMLGAARLGVEIAIASPAGYGVQEPYRGWALADAETSGSRVVLTSDPAEAVGGADVVYTDVWTSMGREDEQAQRSLAFRGYCVDEALMRRAGERAVFMHCLPLHRGEEVSASVADGPQSRIFDQAENRLHVQKALLLTLLGRGELDD